MNKVPGSVHEFLLGQMQHHGEQNSRSCKSCDNTSIQPRPDLKQLQEQVLSLTEDLERLAPLLNSAPPEVRDHVVRTISLAKQTINRRLP